MYLTAQIFMRSAAVARVYSWLLTVSGAAQAATAYVAALELPPWGVLLRDQRPAPAVGTFLDGVSAILVLTPLLLPIARAAGVDPVTFGVVLVMNLSIGTVHAAVRDRRLPRDVKAPLCAASTGGAALHRRPRDRPPSPS